MRTTFPWFYKKTEQELKELFDKAEFVFDTNVLLNLYRYSDSTKNDVLKVIRGLSERCFMPNRVALEFFNGRLSVIHSQLELYEKAVGKIRELRRDIEHSKQHPFIGEDLHERSNDLFKELSEELEAGRVKHASRINVDDILDDVSDIFDGKVGQSKSEDELNKIATEAENRFKNKIPPGYEDASKAKDCTALHDKLRAYGDYIIWDEIIKHAKSTDVDIIFVTDDVKVDWWQKEKGNIIGPRVELVKEFSDKTGKLFHMYTVERFLEYVSTFVNTGISKESVREVNDLKEEQISYSNSKSGFLNQGNSFVKYNYINKDLDRLSSAIKGESDMCYVLNALEARDYIAIISWVDAEKKSVLSSANHFNDDELFTLIKIKEISSRLLRLQDEQKSNKSEFDYYELGGKIFEYFRYKSKRSENY
ncbi:PIN-like domain-containing protein [Shewanella sp. Iso12]|uniref:PIN-like domain-containing protein n=1 Tax=Shewanella sp. Iso12 TaxID=1826753 RepID=UPI001430924A|nr:PIN-like domain-containing protein [Shewanella sp. Iso12]NJI82879.1 DUF4935 domain-containing protein [Shewanella sp. Iso12]